MIKSIQTFPYLRLVDDVNYTQFLLCQRNAVYGNMVHGVAIISDEIGCFLKIKLHIFFISF